MAGSPTFFGEGHEPRVHDTRWRILQKILGALIDGGGGGGGGTPQVFQGHGAPSGLQAGQNGALAAVYYDIDEGFLAYPWSVADQGWVGV